ncbi:hypothetical protein DLM76_14450 [Leptospira yasudae]|nr:hypothetical protein DLM76_14450 [Leptospira yasudae]
MNFVEKEWADLSASRGWSAFVGSLLRKRIGDKLPIQILEIGNRTVSTIRLNRQEIQNESTVQGLIFYESCLGRSSDYKKTKTIPVFCLWPIFTQLGNKFLGFFHNCLDSNLSLSNPVLSFRGSGEFSLYRFKDSFLRTSSFF